MKIIYIRKSQDRGFFDYQWLKTYHSFSFGQYYNEKAMNFSDLRVINEDIIAPNSGFGLHPHKNMEIITYILSGTLTHSDNLGNKEEINQGEFQIMSAGSGIIHGEFNHQKSPCHLLQIWISPEQNGGQASYKIHQTDHLEKWALIACNNDEKNAVKIKQQAKLYVIDSNNLKSTNLPEINKSNCYLHVAIGKIKIADNILKSGYAIAFQENPEKIEFLETSKILLFYLQ